MNPTWPRGYHRKGTALYYLEQYEEAVNTYKEGLSHDPGNAELMKSLNDVGTKAAQAQAKGPGQGQDMNAMMQMYMKLMTHPETKDIISDPTFMPILQSIMANPTEAIKHMNDSRVQKIFKVLQENASPEDFQKASKNFKPRQAEAEPE